MDRDEGLCRQELAAKEAAYGPDHPEVAVTLANLAGLLLLQERFDDAVPVLRRCLEIKTAAYGPDHPDVVHVVKLLGATLEFLGRGDEATALRPKASQTAILRREGGKKYLDFDGAHAVVHLCSTVENYLDRYASGGLSSDELTWFKDGTIGTPTARLFEDQECCHCGMSFWIRPRFPNTSAQVRCSHCGQSQVLYVVQLPEGLERAMGIEDRLVWGHATMWLAVPLQHPEFSTLLRKHGVVTWKSPRRLGLKRIGARFQNTWQGISWFEGERAYPWWPRYREKFSGVEIRTET